MPLNLSLLGPPGAGKTVQSQRLARYYHLDLVATGSILRAEVRAGTALGKLAAEHLRQGRLVPGDLVLQAVGHRFEREATGQGVVLDGFPRKMSEARATDRILHDLGARLARVFLLHVPDEVASRRVITRLVCHDCGAIYNTESSPPTPGEVCPACRTVLHSVAEDRVQCEACSTPIAPRPDDRPEIVRDRLIEYHTKTKPVIDYYQSKGLLEEVDATAPEVDVFHRILDALGEPWAGYRRAG